MKKGWMKEEKVRNVGQEIGRSRRQRETDGKRQREAQRETQKHRDRHREHREIVVPNETLLLCIILHYLHIELLNA